MAKTGISGSGEKGPEIPFSVPSGPALYSGSLIFSTMVWVALVTKPTVSLRTVILLIL